MTESNSQPFDAARAVEYGKLVNVAYAMVGDESNLMPPCGPLASGLEFVAWVQMRDFIFNSTTLRFYGLIVHRVGTPNQYVLAIRGTIASNLEEWVDNLTSVDGVAVPHFGNVGYGFHRIFETMQVIKEGETTPTDEFGKALTVHKPFEWQVAEVVRSHADKLPKTEAVPPEAISVEVTAHSLGSALATLYVAKNANAKLVHVPRIYTFASPLVGNGDFVAAFAKLKDVDSWRIANPQDIVTQVPRIDLKNAELFEHVEQELKIDSADQVNKTLRCLHSMTTYLHFVDPTQWLLDKWCAWIPDDDPGPNIGGDTPD